MADLMRGRRPPFFPPCVNNLSDHFGVCVTPGMPNYAGADAVVVNRFLCHPHPIIATPPRAVFDAGEQHKTVAMDVANDRPQLIYHPSIRNLELKSPIEFYIAARLDHQQPRKPGPIFYLLVYPIA